MSDFVSPQKILLLFGRTGAGKSTLGNVILGKSVFTAADALGSVTNKNSLKEAVSDDRRIALFDTIGIGDTSLPQNEVVASISETVAKTRDGIDLMIFVMQYGRITEVEKQTFLFVVNHLFGTTVLNNMYLVFTHAPERLVHGDQAERAAFLAAEASSSASRHFAEIWNCMGRITERIVFIDNPDPASTRNPAQRAIWVEQAAHTQRTMLAIVHGWMGARYQSSAMKEAQLAYERMLAQEKAEREAALQYQVDAMAKAQVEIANAKNETDRLAHEKEMLQLRHEHEQAMQQAKHEAELAAEAQLRQGQKSLEEATRSGGIGEWVRTIGGAVGGALAGPLGKLVGDLGGVLATKAAEKCSVM